MIWFCNRNMHCFFQNIKYSKNLFTGMQIKALDWNVIFCFGDFDPNVGGLLKSFVLLVAVVLPLP